MINAVRWLSWLKGTSVIVVVNQVGLWLLLLPVLLFLIDYCGTIVGQQQPDVGSQISYAAVYSYLVCPFNILLYLSTFVYNLRLDRDLSQIKNITVVFSSTPSTASSSSSFTCKATKFEEERKVRLWNRNEEVNLRVRRPAHLIVVWAEVLEVAEAGVADTDEDGDAQNDQSEHGRGSLET